MLKNLLPMVTRIDKWYLVFLLPLLLFTASSFTPGKKTAVAHPLYVSVTEINHNASEKSLEISCKVFADDLEEALKRNFKVSVNLSNAAQQEKAGELINAYMKQHLQLRADGKAAALHFVGFEKERESVYCYFEAQGLPTVKKLDISNSILHDFTESQINIVHVSVGGVRKSTKLDFPAKTASFQF